MIRVPHNRIAGSHEEADAVAATVLSGRWSSLEGMAELEGRLSSVTGRRHAICVDSGLSALRLSLLALGLDAGDRVLVPAYSCVALANACLAIGAVPVEVDVRDGTWNLDDSTVDEGETAKVAIAVDTFGVPASFERLEERGITVIEDCAHALGAVAAGRPLGARSAVAVTSFHATKLIGAGEGGAVLTDDDDVADRISWYRDYADKPADGRMLNCRMSDLEAALGARRLQRLPDLVAERRVIAERYREAFVELAQRDIADLPSPANLTWYRFVLRLKRVEVGMAIEALAAHGVGAAAPVEDWRSRPESTPVSSVAYERLLSLPIFPGLTDEEQSIVIEMVNAEAKRW